MNTNSAITNQQFGEAVKTERERILVALNADLSWCEKNGASYQNCIDFSRLQKIVLNP